MKTKTERNKLGIILSTILVIIVITTLLCAIYGVVVFLEKYGVRSPLVFQSPVYSKEKNILITPVGSKSAKHSSILNLGQIADKIYALESSRGVNDGYCKNLGMFNGFGYGQDGTNWNCYSSHSEVRNLVIKWLSLNIPKYGLQGSLCRYNTGDSSKGNCTYAVNYKSL